MRYSSPLALILVLLVIGLTGLLALALEQNVGAIHLDMASWPMEYAPLHDLQDLAQEFSAWAGTCPARSA
jgi:hypothetical protein